MSHFDKNKTKAFLKKLKKKNGTAALTDAQADVVANSTESIRQWCSTLPRS